MEDGLGARQPHALARRLAARHDDVRRQPRRREQRAHEAEGALGVGAYFTPIHSKADQYAKESGGQTIAAYLDINKPLVIHASQYEHPCVQALVLLGVSEEKASKLVERVEEKYGYLGSEIKNLAMKQGYDGIFEYFNNVLTEIVVWNAAQVKPITEQDKM